MDFTITGGNEGAKIYLDNEREKDGILLFDVHMMLENAAVPEQFCISYSIPHIDTYSVWSPSIRAERHLGPNWKKRTTESRLASWMPIHALVSATGKNRMTVALSDAKTPCSLRSGECEEDACIQWEINFFTVPVAPLKEYTATVRIDTRKIPYYDAIYDTVTWWEKECGYAPAYVPEHAKLPMNSLWYSYHQQLDVEDIIKECKLSKALGMDTVIVDDGWQTDDNNRGYQFCGDWEVAPSKIPDMKEFVARIHETGMKVMLWFAVPFIGIGTKNFERFSDKILDQSGKTRFSLDPRYKEVREYLIGFYTKAVGEWGFDGLKLDFIDRFVLKGSSLEFDARRDYHSLEDAVDALMIETSEALRKINPEVLIEFRQTYVGPAIRKYGNMLRVGDCPNDAILNRQGIVNLRLTSGNTAVHSDMVMWNREDTVEGAAVQLANILYSVPQISVKLDGLPEDHKKMLAFYLSFWREHRDVLIEGKLLAANPESVYSQVCSQKDGKAIFTVYTDGIVDCAPYSKVIVVNSSRHSALILKGADQKSYRVLDCMGNEVEKGSVQGSLCEIEVPFCGMVEVE
ncbi:MAG: alpha-galactosidase [Ruminococcaceae bacterium]|nr:alpha-galactosidase [Oscillospiraceae bacterium]